MSISITDDIKSVSDLKRSAHEIFKQIHHTGRPVVITVNGKPDVVLFDVEVFERKLKALNLELLLSEAEDEVKKGHTRPARDFLKDLGFG